MKSSLVVPAAVSLLGELFNAAFAAVPDTVWTRTFGGPRGDGCMAVVQTADGGFVLAGNTFSFGAGENDFYVIRTNVAGDTVWTRTYGGVSFDQAYSVQQTSDGAFVVAGCAGPNGNVRDWVMKIDGHGDTLWTRSLGGMVAYCIRETPDHGFIVAGTTTAYPEDYRLVKTDSAGNPTWTRTYGGARSDWPFAIELTSDGGYILAGVTFSFGSGQNDVYLVRTDAWGDTIWTRVYGGADEDWAFGVVETQDSGFAVTGLSASYSPGDRDLSVLRLDRYGDTLWTRTYGWWSDDQGRRIIRSGDGGLIVLGTWFGTASQDLWLLCLNDDGDTVWTRTFGGPSNDMGYDCQRTDDGGYVLAGWTQSFGAGGADAYLVRTSPDVAVRESSNPQAPSHRLEPTVIRGLPVGVVAFDAMGRRVLEPKPGVYFIHEGSGVGGQGSGGTRKVVFPK